jgi:hypothetical protein
MEDCLDPEAPDEVAGLPEDPLVEILSRVPLRSLCRSECVSKAWHNLIANPIHHCKAPRFSNASNGLLRSDSHEKAATAPPPPPSGSGNPSVVAAKPLPPSRLYLVATIGVAPGFPRGP